MPILLDWPLKRVAQIWTTVTPSTTICPRRKRLTQWKLTLAKHNCVTMAGDVSQQSRVIPMIALFVWFMWITAGCVQCNMCNTFHCLLGCCKEEGNSNNIYYHTVLRCVQGHWHCIYECDKIWRVNIIDFLFSLDEMSDKVKCIC